ncbi:unnamed protein product, partial [Owenia fusiformis]
RCRIPHIEATRTTTTRTTVMNSGMGYSGDHKPLKLMLIVGVTIAYTAYVGCSGLLSMNRRFFDIENDFEANNTILDHDLEINPASFTFFVVWGIIYVWQFLWLGYALSTLCRLTKYGYLYVSPNILPASIFFFFFINNGCGVAWFLLYQNLYIPHACAALAMMAFTLYLCLFISMRALNKHGEKLVEQQKGSDIWMIRILCHNGLGMYATWCTIATLLNFATTLVFWANVSNAMASTISLAILAGELLLWAILDNFVLDKFTRYLITPYIVVVFALVGVIVKNWNPDTRNSIMNAVLLGVASAFLLIKIIMVIYRHRRNPVDYENKGTLKPIP